MTDRILAALILAILAALAGFYLLGRQLLVEPEPASGWRDLERVDSV